MGVTLPGDDAASVPPAPPPLLGRLDDPPTREELLADRVGRTIADALWRNVLTEAVVVVILISVAVIGIYLLIRGTTATGGPTWQLLGAGTACQAAIGWPVRVLLKHHKWTTLL